MLGGGLGVKAAEGRSGGRCSSNHVTTCTTTEPGGQETAVSQINHRLTTQELDESLSVDDVDVGGLLANGEVCGVDRNHQSTDLDREAALAAQEGCCSPSFVARVANIGLTLPVDHHGVAGDPYSASPVVFRVDREGTGSSSNEEVVQRLGRVQHHQLPQGATDTRATSVTRGR